LPIDTQKEVEANGNHSRIRNLRSADRHAHHHRQQAVNDVTPTAGRLAFIVRKALMLREDLEEFTRTGGVIHDHPGAGIAEFVFHLKDLDGQLAKYQIRVVREQA
jgi:hypothetical protein